MLDEVRARLQRAATTVRRLKLDEGSTSVGTRIALEHTGASPVGQRVEITASSTYVDGRLHRFTVAARHLERRCATKHKA